MTIRIAAALAAALLALVACEDDGASVRDLGGSASSGSGSGSGSGTGAASGSGTAASGSEPACVERGDSAFAVRLDEFTVTPEAEETQSFGTLVAANVGKIPHELILVEAPNIESLPLDGDRGIDVEALDPEQVILHAGPIENGDSCALEVDLEPSTYVLFCNIVDEGENKDRSHFLRGMRARIKVS